jgi:hypothetical protein
MGKPPLGNKEEFRELKEWGRKHGINTLEDISQWTDEGNWIDWHHPPVPDHLMRLLDELINNLAGCAPMHKNREDDRIWGTQPYSQRRL